MSPAAAPKEAILPYFFAGLCGFAGVIMLAMGSHGESLAPLTTGGQFLLFNATAAMVVTSQRVFDGVYKRAAIALLLIGSAAFSGEIAIHAVTGRQVPLMSPLGGGGAILGWLCIAIGAIRQQKT